MGKTIGGVIGGDFGGQGRVTVEDEATVYSLEGKWRKVVKPIVPVAQGMTLYSQRDPRWADAVCAGGATFGEAGDYVCCVAMVASLAGSAEEPPQVADELKRVGCFGAPGSRRPVLPPAPGLVQPEVGEDGQRY